ncbi:MAG: hypothetical protein R3258_06735 [Acidimicrobiia bacterium]|nr:hypothetical protein [Acidimicrobiia bacterium]
MVLLLAIIGGATAVGFTALANVERTGLFEAAIPLRFDPAEGQSIEDLGEVIEDARGLALLAAEDLLATYPGSSIFADTASARLVFVARGESSDAALAIATELVQAYFDTDPVVGGDVNELLAEYEAQALEIQEEIESLQPRLSAADQILAARHDLLDQQIAALESRIVSLTVNDAVASEEQQRSNALERQRLESILTEILEEKANLQPRPVAALSAAAKLRRDGLQRSLDLLSVDYARVALRSLGVSGGGRLEPATFRNLTPDPLNPMVNGIVGFLGGLALGVFAAAFVARARREFWLPEDLPVPVLAEVPFRKTSSMPGAPWYDSVGAVGRKGSIQALRTTLEGVLGRERSAVALIGEKVDPETTHAIAADLATSFASAGKSVLLVDADYMAPAQISEFDVGEPTLYSALQIASVPEEALRSGLQETLSRAISLRAHLTVIPAGPAPASPADAAAGPQFRALLDEAGSMFDLVLIVAGSSKSPVAQVVAQRVGRALLVLSPGDATSTGVAAVVSELAHRRVEALGAVSIHGSERVLPRLERRRRDISKKMSSVSATDRLSRYPFPGAKASDLLTGGTFKDLAEELVQAQVLDRGDSSSTNRDNLGVEVLESLRSTDNGRAYMPVAQYVIARVEDIMTATKGQANLTALAIDLVVKHGFVPLESVEGHPSIGDQLVLELCDELGKEDGIGLASEFARVLGGDPRDPVGALNDWIAAEFFTQHIERTSRQPTVWHLRSEGGSVQLLVNGRRLDKDTIHKINVELVRQLIDGFEKRLHEARADSEEEEAHRLEEKLRDSHLFQISLNLLHVGSTDEAKLVYPWRRADQQPRGWDPVWTEGIQPNIAPLQRLGLLAAPVLTDEELTVSTASA